MEMEFKVEGGIGDILLAHNNIQTLIDMYGKENLHCYLLSHFQYAYTLLLPFGIKTTFLHYKDNKELIELYNSEIKKIEKNENYLGDVFFLGKEYNGSINISESNKEAAIDFLFKNAYNKYIVGIHPFGSAFSNEFLTKQRKVPSKNIPIETVLNIISTLNGKYGAHNMKYVLFSSDSEEEKSYVGVLRHNLKNVKLIETSELNILTSLSIVDHCNVIIAADSAIKSYSLISEMNTVLVMSDHEDKVRDDNFITPYLNKPYFKLVKFTSSIDKEVENKIINHATKYIDETINNV